MMGAVSGSETSVIFYLAARRYKPEGENLNFNSFTEVCLHIPVLVEIGQ
jgi:hypothetical protein